MVAISIQGLKDGIHDIALSVPVGEVKNMFPEFFGNVDITGRLQKVGNRYTFKGTVECSAKLICDRSLTEYIEPVKAQLSTSYIADNTLFRIDDSPEDDKVYEIKPIREDDREIDITEEVRQELAVNLPMKRIAPEFRDKEITEIFPQVASKKEKKSGEEIDERWAALKNIKFDTNN